MLKIDKIAHIGIATKDLQQTKHFFEGVLGLNSAPEIDIAERSLKICFFPIGDSALEIVMPTAPESPLAEHIAKHGEGIYHLALGVIDIHAALDSLHEQGIALKDRTPRASKIGAHVAFLEQNAQTTNISIELVEPMQ